MNDLKARLSESQLLATSLQKKNNEDEQLIATLRFRNLENVRDVEFMREKIRARQARKQEREQELLGSLEAEKTANAHLTATNAAQGVVRSKSLPSLPLPFVRELCCAPIARVMLRTQTLDPIDQSHVCILRAFLACAGA